MAQFSITSENPNKFGIWQEAGTAAEVIEVAKTRGDKKCNDVTKHYAAKTLETQLPELEIGQKLHFCHSVDVFQVIITRIA